MGKRFVLALVLGMLGLGCTSMTQLQQDVTVRIRAKPSDETQTAQTALEAYVNIRDVLRVGLVMGADPSHLAGRVLGAILSATSHVYVSEGSAFLVRDAGTDELIAVTNKHVVGSAPNVDVILNKHLTIHDCNVRYVDTAHDLAFVTIPELDALGLTTAHLTDKDPENLTPVTAVGFPAMNEGEYMMTRGSISNKKRQETKEDNSDRWYIQHDAKIKNGNSGGPLFREDTLDVVGVNTFMEGEGELFGAIPASHVREGLQAAMSRPASGITGTESVLVESCERLLNDLRAERIPHQSTIELISESFALAFQATSTYKEVENLLLVLQDNTKGPRGPRGVMINAGGMVPPPKNLDVPPMSSELGPPRLAHNLAIGDSSQSLRADAAKLNMYKGFEDLFKSHGRPESDICKNYNKSDLQNYADTRQVKISVTFSGSLRAHPHTFSWRYEQGHWRVISFE